MEDITIKLHIAVMSFIQGRADHYKEARERGFTTAELLGNAALGIGALVVMWTFFKTTLFNDVKDWISEQLHNGGTGK